MKNFNIETIEYSGDPMIMGEDGIWYRFFDDGTIHDVEEDKNGNYDNDIIHFKNHKKARRKDLRRFSVNNNVYINNDVYLNRGKIMIGKKCILISGIKIAIILYRNNENAISIDSHINNLCLTEGK